MERVAAADPPASENPVVPAADGAAVEVAREPVSLRGWARKEPVEEGAAVGAAAVVAAVVGAPGM